MTEARTRRQAIKRLGIGAAAAGLAIRGANAAVKPVLDAVFNVKDFGAKGDGTTYDDKPFREALDAIAALSKTSFQQSTPSGFIPAIDARGAKLFVPFGRYRLARTLQLTRASQG